MLRTLAWAPAHFALSLVLHGKSRAKSFTLAELRQLLVVIRHAELHSHICDSPPPICRLSTQGNHSGARHRNGIRPLLQE
ncbi:hypothetical protein CH373_06060 [Leptospira perolatii]|uniref:Uncharacterized protein n=1 Tax=Leptospira perolatii TaxID=2023191 RepID=A0A2M9ZNT9_9LEPT|nr:hypothetical protein CH360_04790 [Leptospira perolatii]PJZ73727.1 hypothetical protein CH373_06060 [Leptospira perolatii]